MAVLHHMQKAKPRGFAQDGMVFFAPDAQHRTMGRPRTSARTALARPLKNLTTLREARGLSQEALAELAGCSPSQISRYESGSQPVFMAKFMAIVRALRLSDAADVFVEASTARMIGYVGAGAVVHSDEDDGERIPAPPDMDEPCALRVTGTSMMPAYRPGDILFCEERATNSSDILNHDCVVETLDGRRLVKKVLPGGAPDSVRLFSYETQEAEPDVRLRSAAIVRWVQRA